MFKRLSLEEFQRLSKLGQRVAVYQEFPCDDLTPYVCFDVIRQRGSGCVLLESAIKDKDVGRFSLLAFDPVRTFTAGVTEQEPLERLRSLLKEMRCSPDSELPPLVGGAVGFLSYDAVRHFEKVPDRHQAEAKIPDFLFYFHNSYIAFDHMKGSMTISVVTDGTDYEKAMEKIAALKAMVMQPSARVKRQAQVAAPVSEEMSDAAFGEKVALAKEHIAKGDAFQIVLSRTFSKPFQGSFFDVYRALRMTNPSPFMFYIEAEDFAIAGASPERLVKLEKGKIQTMPIAGTRPRNPAEDERVGLELLADPKEDAEHMMLVDLGRNDLGAVAEIGSVTVKELKTVRHFAHVTHLVSILEADLKKQYDALDALRVAFPAGTLSGAPKIRAMEIIDAIEDSRRGVYGGAICSIDNAGEMDSCIAIRMAVLQGGQVTVRAGAGIVFDSDPAMEAQETRHKAKGVLEAIRLVEEGVL